MELKEFITQTIVNISEGVIKAKGLLEGRDVLINPTTATNGNVRVDKGTERHIQNVDFDLLVSIDTENSESSESKAEVSAKITVVSLLGLSGKGGSKEEGLNSVKSTQANRIRFSIPISLPPNTAQKRTQGVRV